MRKSRFTEEQIVGILHGRAAAFHTSVPVRTAGGGLESLGGLIGSLHHRPMRERTGRRR